MATRLGIELSAAACRLVEIEARSRAGGGMEPRVRSFAVLPPSGPETDAMLASLKGRRAAVVVWGPPSEHRQIVVTRASYEMMRREAVAALATLGRKTGTALADIAPLGDAAEANRRPVVVALAAADPMLQAIQPLVSAGIRVRSLATPAMALAEIARVRRASAVRGVTEAYIAVEEASTCIALMRDGALAVARELPWGYVENGPRGAVRARDDIAARLAAELDQYREAVESPAAAQVCVCGGLPELRSMAATLTDLLDVEVEPLDSLFGIDATHLPDPADDFRERVAELRLAWAAAADWPPFLNLLRARRRERSRRMLGAAAIAAGIVAGVGGAWQLARSDWARAMVPHRAPEARTASVSRQSAPPPASAAPRPSTSRPSTSAPIGSAPGALRPSPAATPAPTKTTAANAPAPRPPLASRSAVPAAATVTAAVRPPAVMLTADLRQPTPAPLARATAPPRTPPPPPAVRQSPPPAVRQSPPPAVRQPAAPAVRQPAVPAARPVKPEPVTPFDASLETILYGPDRKLAIVDGRIVETGDEVRGARIVEITPTTVVLRDAAGRLRRLTLGGGRR